MVHIWDEGDQICDEGESYLKEVCDQHTSFRWYDLVNIYGFIYLFPDVRFILVVTNFITPVQGLFYHLSFEMREVSMGTDADVANTKIPWFFY